LTHQALPGLIPTLLLSFVLLLLLCLCSGIGYIAYTMMFNGPEFLNKRTALALSDPVCDPQHYAHIAAAFLQQHPRAMFCQVGA
jgi:hypothetical protein